MTWFVVQSLHIANTRFFVQQSATNIWLFPGTILEDSLKNKNEHQMLVTPKSENNPENEDDPENENDTKNEDNPKKEPYPPKKDNPKIEENPNF